jgi:hypothetical protein
MEEKQKALELKFEDLKKIIESKEEELQVISRFFLSREKSLLTYATHLLYVSLVASVMLDPKILRRCVVFKM